jgi:hypothetical protein
MGLPPIGGDWREWREYPAWLSLGNRAMLSGFSKVHKFADASTNFSDPTT